MSSRIHSSPFITCTIAFLITYKKILQHTPKDGHRNAQDVEGAFNNFYSVTAVAVKSSPSAEATTKFV
jgi:hypothetical protein